MFEENGSISIHTENIFPIIKRWLYSDKDIFVRELISNGCDAISKLKRLNSLGEANIPQDTKFEIKVFINKNAGTIKFTDNGIGMTAEEVKKYINQVAFSGAEDFLQKYKEKIDEANDIIGHFGLGFYSAFMVAEKVEIDTLSYVEGSEAVNWVCDGGTEYAIKPSGLSERGTIVTLHLDEEGKEFLDYYKLSEIIKKHCAFLPTEIYLIDETEEKKEENEEKKLPLNDTNPLWMKNPKDCTEEEYKEFYKKVFNDYRDPLFWIHLNVDYPFNLKGILYFPKLEHELNASEGQVKLYNNQVFVADNIKEVIPEFLLLLKGVVDCSDLPLNVSRSFLQRDTNVNKISRHITNKVADKLTDLFKKEREKFNEYWSDIHIFIKYGCMRDEKFYDKVKNIIIFKSTNEDYVTLDQYFENNGIEKDSQNKQVFYASDEKQQAQYIRLFKEQNLEAVILNSAIDTHFISFLEMKEAGVKFSRIDSDLASTLKDEMEKDDTILDSKLENIFKKALNKDSLKIKIEGLKSDEMPALMLLSEQSRRMQEMSAMFGGMDVKNMFPSEETLVLNKNNSLVQSIINLNNENDLSEDHILICEYVYDLAVMSQRPLEGEEMAGFIKRSNTLLSRILVK